MERAKKHEISSRYQRQSKLELHQLCVCTTVRHARHKTNVKNLPETHCRWRGGKHIASIPIQGNRHLKR